jgi:hypothetical protein
VIFIQCSKSLIHSLWSRWVLPILITCCKPA